MAWLSQTALMKKHDAWKGRRVSFVDPIQSAEGVCLGVFNGNYQTLVLIEQDDPRQVIDVDLDYVKLLEPS